MYKINTQNTNKLTRCSFCSYWTGSSCMVTPSAFYCRRANDEYYQHLKYKKVSQQPNKSLRPWDRNR